MKKKTPVVGKSGDYVCSILQYKVRRVKSNARRKIIGKTWLIYNTNEGKKLVENPIHYTY